MGSSITKDCILRYFSVYREKSFAGEQNADVNKSLLTLALLLLSLIVLFDQIYSLKMKDYFPLAATKLPAETPTYTLVFSNLSSIFANQISLANILDNKYSLLQQVSRLRVQVAVATVPF